MRARARANAPPRATPLSDLLTFVVEFHFRNVTSTRVLNISQHFSPVAAFSSHAKSDEIDRDLSKRRINLRKLKLMYVRYFGEKKIHDLKMRYFFLYV